MPLRQRTSTFEIFAISVVATLAGSFGAFFHRRGMELHPIGQDQA